jgi:hypothetical protein
MNYKTIIAFLGKNQMKDWATPSFSWILASSPKDAEWNNEFAKLMQGNPNFKVVMGVEKLTPSKVTNVTNVSSLRKELCISNKIYSESDHKNGVGNFEGSDSVFYYYDEHSNWLIMMRPQRTITPEKILEAVIASGEPDKWEEKEIHYEL